MRSQYTRTAALNKVASELNRLFEAYYRNFKDGDTYQRMLSRLRKVPSNHHILLLNALRDFDLHARYPLGRMGIPKLSLKVGPKKFEIELVARTHAILQEKDLNDYFFEVMLVQWNNVDEDPTVSKQQSEWIRPSEPLPDFVFTFTRFPGTTRWMFLLRIMMGKMETEANSSIHEGVRIMEVGSFLPADRKLLIAARRPKMPDVGKMHKEPEMKRVKRRVR